MFAYAIPLRISVHGSQCASRPAPPRVFGGLPPRARRLVAQGAPTRPRQQRMAGRAKDLGQSSAAKPLSDVDETYWDTHAFSSFAHWLVPDALMVGRYPFMEPSRCKTRIQGEDQIRSILEAGVTIFYSLQDELPKQVDMPIGGIRGFMPYKAVADLIGSAVSGPVPQEQQLGLMNPWKRDALVQENKIKPEYRQYPIVDLDIPDNMDSIHTLVDELQAMIESRKKVYLHCWGGRGRAGVIGACYLVKVYGLSAEEALERVQLSYDTRLDNQRVSPETDAQRQFVRDFASS